MTGHRFDSCWDRHFFKIVVFLSWWFVKTLSCKFVFELLLLLALFSFILYAFGISQFLFPHFAIAETVLYTEKNLRKRIIYMLLGALVLYQFSAPFSLFFLIVAFLQIYVLTSAFFASTAFDYSLTALLNIIFVVFITNFDKMLYSYVFTSEISAFSLLFPTAFSSAVSIFLFIVFKPKIDTIFSRETWL